MSAVPDTVVAALAAANRAAGGGWVLAEPLAPGWQEGAWLLRRRADRAVLKVHAEQPARVLAARARIDRARLAGWRTPPWLATGTVESGAAWVLQGYVDGRRPECLDRRVADGLIELLAAQRGLGGDAPGWGTWARGVVFDDWEDYRARVSDRFPRGAEVVRLVDAIAASCTDAPLAEDDLVHGNFALGNTVDDGERVWIVDAHTVGPGPVAYDLAEAVVASSAQRTAKRAALDRLWQWGVTTLDARDVAVCAASVAFTMADAYDRLGHMDEAGDAAAGLLEALASALGLVS